MRLSGSRVDERRRRQVDRSVAAPPASSRHPSLGGDLTAVQRTIDELQRTAGNRAVQRLVGAGGSRAAGPDALGAIVARSLSATRGQGRPLEPGVRRRLEGALGADLSRVTVHTDDRADSLARQLSATAFTTGSDIFFREGRYDPTSTEGFRTLAHEATHVVQQSEGPVDGAAHGPITVSDPGDAFEREAETVAEGVVKRDGAEPAPARTAESGARPRRRRATAATSVQRDTGDGTTTNDTQQTQQVKDIPFVKFTGDPEVLTPSITAGKDFYASYEVVNMGTAPTTAKDQVWGSAIIYNTVVNQAHRDLDNPVLAPNGGSHKGMCHIPGWKLAAGDWQIDFAVTNAAGQDADEAKASFTVLPRDTGSAGGGSSTSGGS